MAWRTWLIPELESREIQLSAPIAEVRAQLSIARTRRDWPRIEGLDDAPTIAWRGIHHGLRWNGTIQLHPHAEETGTRLTINAIPDHALSIFAMIPLVLVGATGVLGTLATLLLAASGQLPFVAILTAMPIFLMLTLVPAAIGYGMRAINHWTTRQVAERAAAMIEELVEQTDAGHPVAF